MAHSLGTEQTCLILTDNLIEAEDLADLVETKYALKPVVMRKLSAAEAHLAERRTKLVFMSTSLTDQEDSWLDRIAAVLQAGIVLISGDPLPAAANRRVLVRPFTTRDVETALLGIL